jgi:hypothetical protein
MPNPSNPLKWVVNIRLEGVNLRFYTQNQPNLGQFVQKTEISEMLLTHFVRVDTAPRGFGLFVGVGFNP